MFACHFFRWFSQASLVKQCNHCMLRELNRRREARSGGSSTVSRWPTKSQDSLWKKRIREIFRRDANVGSQGLVLYDLHYSDSRTWKQ